MSHSTIDITDDNFKSHLASEEPVLLDFWAAWCGPCRMVSPIVEQLADEYQGKVKVGKVDIAINPVVSNQFQIKNIPTLVIMKGGKIVFQHVGLISKPDLKKQMETALG